MALASEKSVFSFCRLGPEEGRVGAIFASFEE